MIGANYDTSFGSLPHAWHHEQSIRCFQVYPLRYESSGNLVVKIDAGSRWNRPITPAMILQKFPPSVEIRQHVELIRCCVAKIDLFRKFDNFGIVILPPLQRSQVQEVLYILGVHTARNIAPNRHGPLVP